MSLFDEFFADYLKSSLIQLFIELLQIYNGLRWSIFSEKELIPGVT